MFTSELFVKMLEYGLYAIGTIAIVGYFFGFFGSIFAMINIGKYFWKTQGSENNSGCDLRDYQRGNSNNQRKGWDMEVSAKLESDRKQLQATKQIWIDVRVITQNFFNHHFCRTQRLKQARTSFFLTFTKHRQRESIPCRTAHPHVMIC